MRIAVLGPANPRGLTEHLSDSDFADIPVGLGGSPVTALVNYLLRLGHEVALITVSPDIKSPVSFHGPRLTIDVTPYRPRARDRARDLFARERAGLRDALNKREFEIVHAHWTYEFAWAALGARAPVVVTAHDSPLDILGYHRDIYRLIRTAMALRVRWSVRHLTAVSPYLAVRWKRSMRYRQHIDTIPNITPFIRQEKVLESSTRGAGPQVLEIADSGSRKNVRTLLSAFAIVRAKFPVASLALLGSGLGPEDRLAGWARSSGLSEGVRFLGQCDRATVERELRRATVFAHAALEEAQPMCLLEAMAFELPIVAGRQSGGVPWTLDNGEAGLLVDVADPEALAGGIIEISGGDALTERRVERGVRLLAERYAGEAVAANYVAVYERIVRQS